LVTAGLLAVPTASAATQSVTLYHSPMQHDSRNASEAFNWSGYFKTGAAGTFHAATARWVVPKVAASAGNTFSSNWVGIDGAVTGDNQLIQTGTESDFVGGAAQYDAWWEILPAAETPVFTVKPGDVMTAFVKKLPSGKWSISITDKTSGKSFTTQKSFSGKGRSAEWIEERPQVGGSLATLAHYGKATFDPTTVNGNNSKLKAANRILMVNNAGTAVISTPSNPDSDTDGFRAAFGSALPAPPAS